MTLKIWVKPVMRELCVTNTEGLKSRVYADASDFS